MPSAQLLEIQYSTEVSGLFKTGIDARTMDSVFRAIAEKIGVTAGSLVSEPPVARHLPLPARFQRQGRDGAYMSKFKSKESQGYFFGVVVNQLDGHIFPYVRGRGLSEQLTAQLGLLPFTISRKGQAYIVTVGVNASYAPLVVGEVDEQADYHKDVWTPLSQDVLSSTARSIYLRVIKTELKAAIVAFTK